MVFFMVTIKILSLIDLIVAQFSIFNEFNSAVETNTKTNMSKKSRTLDMNNA